jgi:hypothetical protein
MPNNSERSSLAAAPTGTAAAKTCCLPSDWFFHPLPAVLLSCVSSSVQACVGVNGIGALCSGEHYSSFCDLLFQGIIGFIFRKSPYCVLPASAPGQQNLQPILRRLIAEQKSI